LTKLGKLSRSVKGRVAIITGAGSGMGRATARVFADEGVRLALFDINQNSLDSLLRELEDANVDARGWVLDVSDADAIKDAVVSVRAHFSGIDILINNAGISLPTKIDDDDYEDKWERSISVLLSAQHRLIRAALPALRESDSPRIVNIASTEGLGATRFSSPYTAAKHGVIGLTRSLAVELGSEGITVNCICPGPINTAMTQEIPDEQKNIFARRRVALRRYGNPEEVAHATLNFVLPAASFITGTALPVDGGLTIRNA
jgi:3-oxoacyl-[acyl-carrier protein] reductase